MTVKIYHNPKCSTSRKTLSLLQEKGLEPEVVLYLKTPLDAAQVLDLAMKTGEPLRTILRERGTPFEELGLGDEKWSEQQLADFVVEHPILLNRPIVETAKGARLCRPIERVEEIL
mgnify:CR=1 FL=1|jgi:arsenate reductase (glutaredoxin)